MDTNLLLSRGAILKSYRRGEYIFHEGEDARYYYQLEEGQVKMFNLNVEGREYTQGLAGAGESFGLPPLFIDEKYPASAMACQSTTLFRLPKDVFLILLMENPDIQSKFLKILAKKAHSKAVTAREIINNTPCHRILALLNDYKKRHRTVNQKLHIPFTRQEIANMSGLRVETVIRTLSVLKEKKMVDIVERKLYF
jgi:CRP-like cAMP-binding protein